jgi:ribosome-associated protein
MAKHPVKPASPAGRKSAAKKAARPAAKKTATTKRSTIKKSSLKKPVTEKEREQRAANLIANSEKKKKPVARKRKSSGSEKNSGLLDAMIEGMRDKKAKNIMVLDMQGIENRVADYFVICDADSKTHVNSIADGVEDTVERMAGERAFHSEGQQNGEWILLDYINIIGHVFLREAREHYNIEALWGDAEISLIND